MKHEHYTCEICNVASNDESREVEVFGIRIVEGRVQITPGHQSYKHLCEECLGALDIHFNPKGEDIKI